MKRPSKITPTPFDELTFSEKSKCWSTSFSYHVRVTNGASVERLLKKLDRSQVTHRDNQSVVDSRFLGRTATELYLKVKTEGYRQTFDIRQRLAENEMLSAFGVKPLAVRVDEALAYFGVTSKEFNCRNAGGVLKQASRSVRQNVETATW